MARVSISDLCSIDWTPSASDAGGVRPAVTEMLASESRIRDNNDREGDVFATKKDRL